MLGRRAEYAWILVVGSDILNRSGNVREICTSKMRGGVRVRVRMKEKEIREYIRVRVVGRCIRGCGRYFVLLSYRMVLVHSDL